MKICLVMIVRDEESTLPRLAASLKGKIDTWVIVDTGSTDRTYEVIPELFKFAPGFLYQRPWVNFGHNRTEALDMAREVLTESHWLLVMDADQALEGELPDSLLDSCDAYTITQTFSADRDFMYANIRLFNSQIEWEYRGAVHEVARLLDPCDEPSLGKINSCTIVDYQDGGHRHGDLAKRLAVLEDDIALLRADLEHDPDNARSQFYLAYLLQDCNHLEESIEANTRRIEMIGFAEEAYISRLRIGEAMVALGRAHEAFDQFLMAWESRPWRAEALYRAVRQLRELGRYHAAYALLEHYDNLVAQDEIMTLDTLFVDESITRWRLAFERSVCAYYVRGPYACEQQSLSILALRADGVAIPPEYVVALNRNMETSHQALRQMGRTSVPRHY